MSKEYTFLRHLCRLYDGEHFVPEAAVRKNWKKCPSHAAILNMGKDVYFEYNYDFENPGYMPTPQGASFVSERRRSNVTLFLTVLTLFVALLTLAATLAVPILQALFQK